MTSREHHLERIHIQLVEWQENLATRVAGEAESLDIEIGNLRDDELEDALRHLRTGHSKVLAGCDIVRDLRRQLEGRPRDMTEGSFDSFRDGPVPRRANPNAPAG